MKPGDIVIVRSNEEEPVFTGIFQRYDQKCHGIPVVKNWAGQEFWCGAMVHPYDETLYSDLCKMSGKAGWEYLRKIRENLCQDCYKALGVDSQRFGKRLCDACFQARC